MRFRKSVTICKGVRVNFSKSGASLNVGPKGASMSFGPKGTYLNTGIPGTGLYDRTKIGGSSKKKTVAKRNNGVVASKPEYIERKLNVSYNEETAEIIILDEAGEQITNPTLLKQIKQTEEYRALIENCGKQLEEEYNSVIEEITNIHKEAIFVHSTEWYKKNYKNFEPRKYEREVFYKPEPVLEDAKRILRERAEKEVSTIMFWKKDKAIEKYINEHLGEIMNSLTADWQKEKDSFERYEDQREEVANELYIKEASERKESINRLLENDPDEIDKVIDEWISTVEFPFEFNLGYEVDNDQLKVDLDLPEIEDMPMKYAKKMANGTVKVKDRTQKDNKIDYYNCVLGMAVFFATHLAELAVGIQTVQISAFTQRRNKVGDLVDDYIYSVKFDREGLRKIDNSKNVDEIVLSFENRINVKTDKAFKAIEPY